VKKWTWANGQAYERTFDHDGRVSTITLGPDTASYGDLSQVFGYDTLNRLVSANLAAGQTQSFTYDANSNRTNATVNGASTVYTYPGTSHKLMSLSGATSRSFTYDNAGNITASASVTYVYDGRGRMKQAGSTTYLVNGLGQRVQKSGGTTTYFAYDEAGHLIGEYDATGAPIQETLWLNDTPVAVVKPATPSGFTVYYIWTDLLDSPRLITDSSNQSRWEWSNSDPFGNNLPNENPAGAGAFTYNLRFPGQYYDAETGKHYNYFRDYDPGVGRYLKSDPIGLLGGMTTYSYVGGNPLAAFDSRGLYADCKPIAIGPWLDAGQFRMNERGSTLLQGFEFDLARTSGPLGSGGPSAPNRESPNGPRLCASISTGTIKGRPYLSARRLSPAARCEGRLTT